MKINKIKYLMASALLAVAATSCTDYLDVNKNTDAPDEVEAYLYLAGIEQEYYGIYYDIRATGPLTQMMGTSSYTTFATHFYTKSSDAGGEAWRMVYWNQGMNLENMISQSEASESWTLAGIGYAIKAYSWDLMTKLNCDLPMKQAFVSGLLSHEYDYQQEIYEQVRKWAKTAIEYLQKEDKTNYGTRISQNDYIYGGDKAKWIKFAYTVIARNLASLTNKDNFKEKYYNDFLDAVSKGFQSVDDDATLTIAGGGADAAQSTYNNFFGPYRGNLTYSYFQHDYAVQLFTGTVPYYDENGDKVRVEGNTKYPYQLAETQIITDTLNDPTHFDPRRIIKLATTDGNDVAMETSVDSLMKWYYIGSTFTSASGPLGTAPSFWGRNEKTTDAKDGEGRWLYSNGAPYILCTYSELLFDLAEVQYKYGSKDEAYSNWVKAIKADMDFTAKYIINGSIVSGYHQGDKISKATFNTLAQQYIDGPYVKGLGIDNFTLSHIMMQKFIALYPWGADEEWVDQRKYMYDIQYDGQFPYNGNGWDKTLLNQKRDEDATKVFKGLYLYPANVTNRRGTFNAENNGSPCFRLRPRYNSEYMWNLDNLKALKPINGNAKDFQCSIPWFAYPMDDLPETIPGREADLDNK